MRDPDDVALDEIANALDDHSAEVSYGHSWWFDPSTAEVMLHRADVDDDTADDLDGAGLVHIDALPSFVGYGDMEDFIEDVSDPRAGVLLERAIEGRGAFRRFQDRLFEFPELREATALKSSDFCWSGDVWAGTAGGFCGSTPSRSRADAVIQVTRRFRSLSGTIARAGAMDQHDQNLRDPATPCRHLVAELSQRRC